MNTPLSVFACVILLGWLGFLFGYLLSRLLRFSARDSQTIAMEIGIQNGPLAIAIVAFTFMGPLQNMQQAVMAVPALYSLFIVISATLLTIWFRRVNTAEQRTPKALL